MTGTFQAPTALLMNRDIPTKKQSYSAPYTQNPAGGMKQPLAVKSKNSGCVTAIIIFIILMFVLPALFELIFSELYW
ncbi:MAG: hypothetical protein L6V87_03965 [Ruminococcus sp.]|nr:MAG: hypothetical protein L6V87_03965 [Ruminococcus sp.]